MLSGKKLDTSKIFQITVEAYDGNTKLATSIDALSVGFTIASYSLPGALCASLIIGLVTLVICLAGIVLGRKFGLMLADRANILGGLILIGIGIEIFLTGIF